MEDYNKYIEITPNFKYSDLGFMTYPPQHIVIVNDQKQRWNGIQICQYCEENGLEIPERFKEFANKTNIKGFNKLINIDSDFKYYESCMESLPCQHGVFINGTYETWYGDDIYKYCVDNNLKVPEHFMYYKDWEQTRGKDGKHGTVTINGVNYGKDYMPMSYK